MQVPTTENHFRKFARLTKLHGLSGRGAQDQFMGLTPEEVQEKLRIDPHLNNLRGPGTWKMSNLDTWDRAARFLVGRPQPFTDEGETRKPAERWGMSQAEANCCLKHWAIFHFASCKPVFVPHDDPSTQGTYPRLPEWD